MTDTDAYDHGRAISPGASRSTGTGDELDRLAANLNAMLERIEGLMRAASRRCPTTSLTILETPLTRLRNRAARRRCGLARMNPNIGPRSSMIENPMRLVRHAADALLMIARAESGRARDGMTEFDAAEIARGVGELV